MPTVELKVDDGTGVGERVAQLATVDRERDRLLAAAVDDAGDRAGATQAPGVTRAGRLAAGRGQSSGSRRSAIAAADGSSGCLQHPKHGRARYSSSMSEIQLLLWMTGIHLVGFIAVGVAVDPGPSRQRRGGRPGQRELGRRLGQPPERASRARVRWPGGGIPLPDADQSRVRFRGPGRLSDKLSRSSGARRGSPCAGPSGRPRRLSVQSVLAATTSPSGDHLALPRRPPATKSPHASPRVEPVATFSILSDHNPAHSLATDDACGVLLARSNLVARSNLATRSNLVAPSNCSRALNCGRARSGRVAQLQEALDRRFLVGDPLGQPVSVRRRLLEEVLDAPLGVV